MARNYSKPGDKPPCAALDEWLARVTGYLEVNCGLTTTEVANAFKHLIEKVGRAHHLAPAATYHNLPPLLTCHL